MTSPRSESDRARFTDLVHAALTRPGAPASFPPRVLVVDVPRQQLALIEDSAVTATFAVSTAAAGVGGEAGSLRTPPGWHRIHGRIGADAPIGAVFASRVATGAVWQGEPSPDDLILTRILTLEGLERGVNRGPGCDSLERFIYIHGTNQEDRLGEPVSHGCVRMANADMIWLFERVRESDPVLIAGTPMVVSIPDPRTAGRFHYAGLGGSGMSALAQFQVMTGGRASGSDRAFDRGGRADARARLEKLGIAVHPQDGSGLEGDCAALVVSTAVEADVPDYAAARRLGIPIVHRSQLLAHFVARYRTVAVAGTSGKSTVVAMIFAILRHAGARPSVITGGDLPELQRDGLWGNAWWGGSDLLVVEADESDGSLVHYEPAVGVLLNLEKDHKEVHELAALFAEFRRRSRESFVVGESDALAPLADGALVFGFGSRAAVRGRAMTLGAEGSTFAVEGIRFCLPVPGEHNVVNALAAIAACRVIEVPLERMVEPLARFEGVGRRFEHVGRAAGVEVIDDFAHNPSKISAALATARLRARRTLAVFQPHGYGPTRFLRAELVDAFAAALRPEDRLWLLDIFYAGGSALRDVSSAELAAAIAERDRTAELAPSRSALVDRLVDEARPGDLILVMGARDPSLTDLAHRILEALVAKEPVAGVGAAPEPGSAGRAGKGGGP
jgi:UDP-N-acetylmuramate--alanine ligase